MKKALLICGQLRTFYDVWDNMKKNIIDENTDVFIYTWDKTGNGRRANHLNIENLNVDKDELQEITNAKKVIVEEFKEDYQIELDGVVLPEKLIEHEPIHYKNNLALFYTLYKVNELKKEYETENNFKYDIVIKTRPDIDFKTKISNEVFSYAKDYLMQWLFRINTRNQVCDKMVISNSQIMDYYCSVFENLNNYYLDLGTTKDTRPIGERLMYRHIANSNIKVGGFYLDAYIKHSSTLTEEQNINL